MFLGILALLLLLLSLLSVRVIVSVPSQSFLYFFAACSAACFSSLSSILFLRFSFRFVCLTFSFSLFVLPMFGWSVSVLVV